MHGYSVMFMMKHKTCEHMTCYKVELDITLQDGSLLKRETRVEQLKVPRTDVKTHNVGSYAQNPFPAADLDQVRRFSKKLPLGIIPANSKVYLRAYCSQKMPIEDKGYCLRVPKAFIPAYLAPTSNLSSLQSQN